MTSISIFSHLRYNFISLPYQLKQNLNVQHRCGGEGSIKKQLRRQNEMALRLASHHKIRACCAHIFTTSWIKLFWTQWVDPCLERTECSDSGRTGRDKLCVYFILCTNTESKRKSKCKKCIIYTLYADILYADFIVDLDTIWLKFPYIFNIHLYSKLKYLYNTQGFQFKS